MKKALAIILSLAMMLALVACGGGDKGKDEGAGGGEASGEPIVVGLFGPMSGTNAAVGLSQEEGIKMAIEEINAAGGINGRPIELISEDDENDATTAVSVVNKLINQDEVDALIGSVNSSVTVNTTIRTNSTINISLYCEI